MHEQIDFGLRYARRIHGFSDTAQDCGKFSIEQIIAFYNVMMLPLSAMIRQLQAHT
jgi:hypothetical protein